MTNEERVRAFHKAMGFEDPVKPTFPSEDVQRLRLALIDEELDELRVALAAGDLVEAADALADLLYVTYGTSIALGMRTAPIFEEVHRTNMNKKNGPTNSAGKKLKPEGWKPPDIRALLVDQGWKETT